MPNCPHCNEPYDASHRMTGDRVWCPHCEHWFLVTHRPGGVTELTTYEAPVSYPRERKRKETKP